jgi:HTH-type transcriptional regulator/antitoxin HipB
MSPSDDMILRTPKDIGAAIRNRRLELGLGQRTLAARVGVSRQWIVEIEGGKPGAALGLVLRTLDALGLRLVLDARKPKRGLGVDIDAIVSAARKPRR